MIYADHNATSPLAPGVSEAMAPYLAEEYGNPSSVSTSLGARAREVVESAREEVAAFVGAKPSEVVFLSGGTESCFSAIVGAFRCSTAKKHGLCSAVEHPAVTKAFSFLSDISDFSLDELEVNGEGLLDVSQFKSALREETLLASMMLANNETGVLFPIAELAAASRERNIPLHVDATQAIGKIPVSFRELGADLLSFSGHKFGAPKGVGALVIGEGAPWQPVVDGGGQESGRRGGTESVPLIVGLAAAVRQAAERLSNGYEKKLSELRDRFEEELSEGIPSAKRNVSHSARLPNTASISFPGVAAADLVSALAKEEIVVSAGSACKAKSPEPSRVLRAMGVSTLDCLSTLRVSFGIGSTERDVSELVRALVDIYGHLRGASDELIDSRLSE